MKKRLLRVNLLLILLLLMLSVSAFAMGAPDHVILSWTEDPATTQTFVWQSDTEQSGTVQIVPRAEYIKTGFSQAAEVTASCEDISLDGSGVWHYEATAAGLTPATTYCYRVGTGGSWSETATFTTSDPSADGITFAYFGDVQVNSSMEEEYELWGALAQAAYDRTPDLAFGLLGGDIVESGISATQFECFFRNAAPVFSQIPLFATNGNHESNFISGKPELYLDEFAFPRNGPEGFQEEFYSFDAANCHILVLNSWALSGEQGLDEEDYERIETWIKKDLTASEADWQIVVTHIPVYAVHSDRTSVEVQKRWAPIFEQYGVDLVFVGHQHVYSRSYPLYAGAIDYENGITYIMGNSGQKFYDSADEHLAARTVYNTATYQLVRIDGDSLTVQTFDLEGQELDLCTVTQRDKQTAFTDVAADAWYAQGVAHVVGNGLFAGVGDGRFAPESTMTRAMFATVMSNVSGADVDSETVGPFSDVTASDWFARYVNWAAASGIVAGTGGGRFSPNSAISLEQMLLILYRHSGDTVDDTAVLPGNVGEVSDWAEVGLRWANASGLLDGVGGTLSAKGNATRAQVAQILMNYTMR